MFNVQDDDSGKCFNTLIFHNQTKEVFCFKSLLF